MFVVTFNLFPTTAGTIPLILTVPAPTITCLGLVHGVGDDVHVIPAAGGIVSVSSIGARELILTVLAAEPGLATTVGGVTQGQTPPESVVPL